jgi:uncharacterized membrane protein (UPF0182 family)
MFKGFPRWFWQYFLPLLGLALAIEWMTRSVSELLWFREVEYQSLFLERLLWQVGLWGMTLAVSLFFLLGNLSLAQRFKWQGAIRSL